MIQLLQQNEQIQSKYEKSMVALEQNNIKLDALAKSDGLTGNLNRRGFTELAEALIEENDRRQKKTLVAYIDMNNLKIVNDRYGHEEGDFSIKLIGLLLTKLFPEGVIGRIGGDEFALAIEYSENDCGDTVVQSIYRAFADFNKDSDKVYNVTVSVGVCVINQEEKYLLQDALAMADEKLYAEKQKRSKHVAKSAYE